MIEVVVPLLFLSLFGGFGIIMLSRLAQRGERDWLFRILALAMILRLAVATMFAIFPATRLFHEDAAGYEWWGQLLAKGWHGEGPALDLAGRFGKNYGYDYIAGAIYYVLPFAPAASMGNAVIGTITVFLVYKLAREFFHPIVARRAALLTALMPSMVLWSSVALKDPVVSLLIVLALLGCVRLKRGFTPSAFAMTVLPVVALQPIRFYMLYFVGFSVVISLGLERGVRSIPGVYKQLFVVGGMVAFIAMMGAAAGVSEGTEYMSFERASVFRHGMAVSANSGFAADADVSTPGAALLFMPLGLATLLLSPFPWQMTSLRALMAAPETIYWWMLMPAVYRGVRFVIRERWREVSPLLIFATTLSCAYALVQGNVGSGFRQRAQIFVILFIFAAVGIFQRRAKRAGIAEQELLTASGR